MNKHREDYTVGDTAYYNDSGYRARVRVVEVLGDANTEAYGLRILQVVSRRGILANSSGFFAGTVFACNKVRRLDVGNVWYMEDDFPGDAGKEHVQSIDELTRI